MPITQDELDTVLKEKFPQAEITCRDLTGDQNHWEVYISAPDFKGVSRIQQHKMVQQAVIDYDIHALSIKTEAR